MKTKIIILLVCLILSFLIIQCDRNNISECESIKIKMLLENVFKKKYLYYALNSSVPFDSSSSFNYFYSENLTIPDNDFYLHWNTILEPTFPDSVILRITKDKLIRKRFANSLYIGLEETNKDTTRIKLLVEYSSISIALSKATFTYFFDKDNCKWNVIDSTFWQY